MAIKLPLVWIDLEMTGLYPATDRILEVATIITDGDLNIIKEGPVLAVNQSEEILTGMNEWCTETHNKTGLVKRVMESKISEKKAEEETLRFLKKHLNAGESPMCGNTIYQDRRFLARYMPTLHDFFHYRNIDVSTLKELARRWKPTVLNGIKKEGTHKALDDIRESVEEMRHYRKHFIIK